jgi:type I restriction enzyme, R subunit
VFGKASWLRRRWLGPPGGERLFESPYIDHAPTGPDAMLPDTTVEDIVAILNTVKSNAVPADGVA